MNTTKYLSGQWKFVKPLSTRTVFQLANFRVACFELETFLAEKGLHLKKFKFYADDFNSYLSLNLDFEDYEILMKERFEFYRFLRKNLPVNHKYDDWFINIYIPKCLESVSSIVQCNERNETLLSLVLDYRQYQPFQKPDQVFLFPSHDFLFMSQKRNKED